jgi:hypothetical protein
MKTAYLITPGTLVAVCCEGSDFKPYTLREEIRFSDPTLTTDGEMIFTRGKLRVLVDRRNVKVIVSEFDGRPSMERWRVSGLAGVTSVNLPRPGEFDKQRQSLSGYCLDIFLAPGRQAAFLSVRHPANSL